ncbi:MAG: lipoyl(octanoyl) transferase [Planctomycetota bacterium]|jgi:lipoyl(octanoyl) transferase
MAKSSISIKDLGQTDYQETWTAMKDFTHRRDSNTDNQLWLTEHQAIFTQGLNGKAEHLLNPAEIPVIQIDRGGQVTYHGPGQVVLYCLLDLHQLGLGVKALVGKIETSIIELLHSYGVTAETRTGAPGVYVNNAKIAALGLRIRKGCCYHGMALNVDMDLEPFSRINPCGYEGLAVTQLADYTQAKSIQQVGFRLANILIGNLNGE